MTSLSKLARTAPRDWTDADIRKAAENNDPTLAACAHEFIKAAHGNPQSIFNHSPGAAAPTSPALRKN